MLEGLEAVPWAALQHAYGSASDVPGLLRRIASSSTDDLDEAWCELWGNAWHQGTVYEATAFVVPFLVELLRRRETPCRGGIARYLAAIATGSSYLDVHGPMPKADPEDHRLKLARELQWVDRAAEAVAAEAQQYWELLRDPSEPISVRDACLWLLHRIRHQGDRLQKALPDFMAPGQPMLLRARAALVAASGRGPGSEIALTNAWEIERDWFVRHCLAAGRIATGLAAAGGVEESLLLGMYLGERDRKDMSEDGSDIGSTLEEAIPHVLKAHDHSIRDHVVSELLSRLSSADERKIRIVVDGLIEIGLPSRSYADQPLTIGDLADRQRMILAVCVDCDRLWKDDRLLAGTMPRGIPSKRSRLRAFIGADSGKPTPRQWWKWWLS